jgi:imidazolonepropionase-like amidohydrolase
MTCRRLQTLISCTVLAMALSAPVKVAEAGAGKRFDGPQEPPFVPTHDIAIVGGLLIDATGAAPKVNYGLVIEGDRITQVDRVEALRIPADAQVIDAKGMTIMPGIINSNQHLQLNPMHIAGHTDMPFDELKARWVDNLGRMPQRAFLYLMQGVTSLRQTSGPYKSMVLIKRRIDEGDIAGPRVFLGGALISSGRGFKTGETKTSVERARWLREEFAMAVVDDVKEDLDQFAGPEFSFWKINLSDAVFDGTNDFTDEEIRLIIDKAHRLGKKVDIHTGRHNTGLRRGLKFDVDTLEHPFNGQELVDEDIINGYVDKGVIIATLLSVRVSLAERWADPHRFNETLYAASMEPREYRELMRYRDKMLYLRRNSDLSGIAILERPNAAKPSGIPPHTAESFGETGPSYDATQERRETSRENVRRFIRAGTTFSLGTDTPTFMNFPQEDPNANEFRDLIELGLSPMDAIQAATHNGAQALGMLDQLGTLEEGKLADVIVVAGNPLSEPDALKRVYAVVKGGVRYK